MLTRSPALPGQLCQAGGAAGDSGDLTFQRWDPEPPALTPNGVPTPPLPAAQLPAPGLRVLGVLPAPTGRPEGPGDAGVPQPGGCAGDGTSVLPSPVMFLHLAASLTLWDASLTLRDAALALSSWRALEKVEAQPECLWGPTGLWSPPVWGWGSLCCWSSCCKPQNLRQGSRGGGQHRAGVLSPLGCCRAGDAVSTRGLGEAAGAGGMQ